jgi:hypothetical protein
MENETVEVVPQPVPVGDPYDKKTPTAMLSRQYLIQTVDLFDSSVTTINPYALLKAIPTNQIYLTRFRYLRSNIKLKFVLVSNQMQYGQIGISFLPYTKDTTSWKTIKQRSQAIMHLLDVSEQEAYEITLPYLSPKLYWDLTDTADTIGWRVDIGALAIQTVSTTASTHVYMKVFASFDEPEAAGYNTTPPAVFQAMGNRGSRWGHWDAIAEGTAKTIRLVANVADASKAVGGAAAKAAPPLYAGVKLAEAVGGALRSEEKEPPSKPVKLEVAPDLNAPAGNVAMLSKLGDTAPIQYSFLPQIHNVTNIREICMIPTFTGAFLLANTETAQTFNCSPFQTGSYADYFKDMFKYWRGSTRILFCFATSPLVSGRVQITLYPSGYSGAPVVHDEGDLPSWIITIKGPTDWALEVPYLSTLPWQAFEKDQYTAPYIVVKLLDSLPQPFDKNVSIYCSVFQSTGHDFEFAGLQSVVPPLLAPPPDPPAVFQSSIHTMIDMAQRIGQTYDFPFQGGLEDVHDVFRRYSSRNPVLGPSNPFTPFPMKLTSWTQAYSHDNFDYVMNLYKFWTGQTNLRLMYSGASTTGALVCTLGSSLFANVQGKNTRAGNSMALTDQTVWPMLEFTFPFQNNVEFDSIWEPNGMYTLRIENPGELEISLISGGPNFQPFYLLPVPDFFFTAKPVVSTIVEEEPKAVFQSYTEFPRRQNTDIYFGALGFNTSTGVGQVTLDNIDYAQSFHISMVATCFPTSSASNTHLRVGCGFVVPAGFLSDGPNDATDTLLFTSGRWCDTNNNQNSVLQLSCEGSYAQPGSVNPLKVYVGSTDSTDNVDWTLQYVVRITPFSNISVLSSPQRTGDTLGNCGINTMLNRVPPVLIVQDSPIDVNVPEPVSVQTDSGTQLATNIISPVPVPVTFSGGPYPDGTMGVFPVNPANGSITPFWTTLYDPYGTGSSSFFANSK